MKTNYYTTKILCAALIIAGIAFGISSCKKDSTSSNNSLASTTVTEADAAQFTSDAVSPSTDGFGDQLSRTASLYTTIPLSCGAKKDTTYIKASAKGVTPSYADTLVWNLALNCSGSIPSNVTLSFAGKGVYSGQYMSAQDTSAAQFVLTGSSSGYLLTANYTRVGVAISKIAKQYTFSTTLNIQSTNIVVDKTTQQIVSGTAVVTIVATSTSGKSFNFNGTVTFLGNKTASLKLNSGKVYPISWS